MNHLHSAEAKELRDMHSPHAADTGTSNDKMPAAAENSNENLDNVGSVGDAGQMSSREESDDSASKYG